MPRGRTCEAVFRLSRCAAAILPATDLPRRARPRRCRIQLRGGGCGPGRRDRHRNCDLRRFMLYGLRRWPHGRPQPPYAEHRYGHQYERPHPAPQQAAATARGTPLHFRIFSHRLNNSTHKHIVGAGARRAATLTTQHDPTLGPRCDCHRPPGLCHFRALSLLAKAAADNRGRTIGASSRRRSALGQQSRQIGTRLHAAADSRQGRSHRFCCKKVVAPDRL